MPISSLYLLGRAVGYRARARTVRELAAKEPVDAQRLTDLASSLERKANLAEQRAWLVDTVPEESRRQKLRAACADDRVTPFRPALGADLRYKPL